MILPPPLVFPDQLCFKGEPALQDNEFERLYCFLPTKLKTGELYNKTFYGRN